MKFNLAKIWYLAPIVLIAAVALVVLSIFEGSRVKAPSTDVVQQVDKPVQQAEEPDLPNIQAGLDSYLSGKTGTYSVVVQSADSGQILAQNLPDRLYFSASLYKLYIGLLAWEDLDSGAMINDSSFLGDNSTLDCLDLMIRESHSPCGEQMLSKYDKQELTDRLRKLGLPNVNVAGFTVSAKDMAVLLQIIYDNKVISGQSKEMLLGSMELQTYDAGLKTGFQGLKVQDKVGFSAKDWHDVGFVTLADGRQVIVSTLTENVGSNGVADLAKHLNTLLTN